MSELSPGQAAKQMLQRQLDELGSLYNAGVRSQSFREWRQATLTCIQRIWPTEAGKSERFRRIPFSPPMGRPGEREVREYFERGCGEAGSLLKDYIAEVASIGLSNSETMAPAAGSPPAPGQGGDDFPTVELPKPSGGAHAAGAVPPKPRLKDMLGFAEATQDPPLAHGARETVPASASGGPPSQLPPDTTPAAVGPGAPPLPQQQTPVPAVGLGAPPLPQQQTAAPPLSAAAQTMADLESRGFLAPPGHTLREPPAAAPAGTQPAPTSPAPQAPAPPRIVVTGNEAIAGTPQRTAPAPPIAPTAEGAGAHTADPNDLGRVADELLRASSALSSLPRRPASDRKPRARDVRSPVPMAIAALALEVETLGVPEGHRSRVRAMLLDLSRRLDTPHLSWDALRDAMSFVMEFPTLGRRVVPLLLPYLDRAA